LLIFGSECSIRRVELLVRLESSIDYEENQNVMKKYDLQFHENNIDETVLSIQMSGELTLESIAEIKEELLKKIPSKKNLEVLISDVEEIDLPFYQFLLSLQMTIKSQQKTINFLISLPEEEEELFKKSGFDFNFS